MKICIVSARFYPQLVGSGTSAYVIASELSNRGHDVTVITDESLSVGDAHSNLAFSVKYVDELEDFAVGKSGFRNALTGLSVHLEDIKPDILHVCNFMPMLLVSMIRPQIHCPIVFTFFNTPVIGERTTGYFNNGVLDTSLGAFILAQNAYDKIVLGSRHYVEAAISLGAKESSIQLSYLAPDVDSFHDGMEDLNQERIIEQYFSQNDLGEYYILPSRITAQKGVLEAIDALAIVHKESKVRHKLLLTGMADPFDKEYAKRVNARIDELSLRSSILVPNKVIDRRHLQVFFQKSNLAIVPSWFEGLGLAAIEAQYLRVPLVVADTVGLNEVVEDGFNGVTFRPKDSSDMASAIRRMIEGKVDVDRLVENAKESVKRFSLDRHISELEATYISISGGRL